MLGLHVLAENWEGGRKGRLSCLFFFFLLAWMRKIMTVFQLSLHLVMKTKEISHLPVSGMGND